VSGSYIQDVRIVPRHELRRKSQCWWCAGRRWNAVGRGPTFARRIVSHSQVTLGALGLPYGVGWLILHTTLAGLEGWLLGEVDARACLQYEVMRAGLCIRVANTNDVGIAKGAIAAHGRLQHPFVR